MELDDALKEDAQTKASIVPSPSVSSLYDTLVSILFPRAHKSTNLTRQEQINHNKKQRTARKIQMTLLYSSLGVIMIITLPFLHHLVSHTQIATPFDAS